MIFSHIHEVLSHHKIYLRGDECLLVCNAYVHSRLMYSALVWGNPSLSLTIFNDLFPKQKATIRILNFEWHTIKYRCRGI